MVLSRPLTRAHAQFFPRVLLRRKDDSYVNDFARPMLEDQLRHLTNLVRSAKEAWASALENGFCPTARPKPGSNGIQQVHTKPASSSSVRNSSGVFQPIQPGSPSRHSGALSVLNQAGPGSITQYTPPGRRQRSAFAAAASGSGKWWCARQL